MGESADKFDDNYGIMMKEIELIQDIIKRMAHNSFLIKGWAITLILTTFLLKSDDLEKGALISLVPLVGFWFLDSFYLSTERNYRKLHEWIIANRKHSLDFCFDLSLKKVEKKESFISVLFSKTMFLFYIPLLSIVAIILTIS